MSADPLAIGPGERPGGASMAGAVFRSADLPVADRFEYWRELMATAAAPMEASGTDAANFRMRQRDLYVDSLRVWTMTFAPVTFHRTDRVIQQSDPETYNLVLVLQGEMGRRWGTQEAIYGPDDLYINDSSRPYDLRGYGARTISCAGVEIPKELLPLPGDRADLLIGRPLSARDGLGALLAGSLTQIAADHGSYRMTDGPRLSAVLRDLVSGLAARVLEDEDRCLTPESRRRNLVLSIRSFIDRHVHDPELTPAAIAAAHHISLSYLHRLFREDGVAVAAWIRERRLEGARRDLADPSMSAVPVHHIAARWGFAHHAAFTRAFRTAYGVPPRDYRHEAPRWSA